MVTGPYRLVRHPMYLAKALLVIGTLLLSGSAWLLPTTIYVIVACLRSIAREEADLTAHFVDYQTLQRKTKKLVPFVY